VSAAVAELWLDPGRIGMWRAGFNKPDCREKVEDLSGDRKQILPINAGQSTFQHVESGGESIIVNFNSILQFFFMILLPSLTWQIW
jgi:hypothetical protein